ncbi:MAG: spore maturation protein [Verrucomicrobiota bacterium]
MLNYIWLALVVLAVAIGGWNNRLSEVTAGAFDGAKTAVTIALGLIGIMALWLGVMRLAERAGLVQRIARGLRPIMRRLFPDVPPEHPAMGSMLMNMAANMLGLGNAATPLGLRAMRDLETLNPRPGVASNAMCTFLAINTASLQLIPATAIALLASAGSTRPTAIVGTALLATLCAATVAITAAKTLEKLPFFRLREAPAKISTGIGDPGYKAAAPGDILPLKNYRSWLGHAPGVGRCSARSGCFSWRSSFAWPFRPCSISQSTQTSLRKPLLCAA